MFRLALLFILPLAVTGCFHVQLNGGIAAAEVTVASLQQPDRVITRLYSHDRHSMVAWKGKEAWDALPVYQQAFWMGVVYLPQGSLRDDALYLVTARGGDSLDSDRNMVMDGPPERIRGVWHAIVPGRQFGQLRNSVSLLTEACYQWLLFTHGAELPGSEQVLQELDALAARLVEDINGDGGVDYNDVLAWNIYTDSQRYLGEAGDLQELAMLISLGFPPEFVVEASRRVVELGPLAAPPVPPPAPRLLDYLRDRLRAY